MKNLQDNSSLNPAHWEEIIKGSGVSEVIARLNFTSIDDPSEVDKLLSRNNDRRWKHWQHGVGWAVSGVDPQTGENIGLGVQFKPDTPVERDGKPQKYLSASGYETAPLFLDTGEPEYWQTVLGDRTIPLFITEGAKKAACLLTIGNTAISLPGVWNGQLKGRLKDSIKQFCGLGRKVYLCFDSDQVSNPKVQQALDRLGRLLSAEGCVVSVVLWDVQYKGIDDLCVQAGGDAIHEAIANAFTFEEWRDSLNPETEAKPPRQTAADSLLTLAKQARYFHTSDKVAYADIWIEGDRHTYAVRSKAFRLWLQGQYYESHGKGIGSQTLQDTIATLEAIAIFKGETHEVNLRTAEHQGKIYLDLGTPDWKAVEIDAVGWRLISDPPVRFWRPDSLLPLPYPVKGGSLDELRQLLNVDGAAWTLIITFLLFCFCPGKTYPVLVLSAHRGSGKTAAAEILKGVIDPGKAPLIKPQGDTHKLAVAASRRWLMAYDNVSHISSEQSDDFCRLATGFGYSTRTLHTTDEETTFELTRPQIITAIDALVTRDDLADRVLMVQLPEITEDMRLPQAELTAKVEAARPQILGALLTALSQTLAELPHTKPDKLPRMADYALVAMAAEKALGLSPGEFRETFDESREQSRQVVIESSPIGEAIMALMRDRLIWKGTASDLLTELERYTEESTFKSRYWPRASNVFKRQLNRLTPDLKALGIEVTADRNKQNRTIVLEKLIKISSLSSPPSSSSQDKGFNDDDKVTINPEMTIQLSSSSPTVTPIVTSRNNAQREFQLLGDDNDDDDDKNTPFPKWCFWSKINTQVEVLERRNGQARIRVPGQSAAKWVPTHELKEGAA
jgi:hypothetical protein